MANGLSKKQQEIYKKIYGSYASGYKPPTQRQLLGEEMAETERKLYGGEQLSRADSLRAKKLGLIEDPETKIPVIGNFQDIAQFGKPGVPDTVYVESPEKATQFLSKVEDIRAKRLRRLKGDGEGGDGDKFDIEKRENYLLKGLSQIKSSQETGVFDEKIAEVEENKRKRFESELLNIQQFREAKEQNPKLTLPQFNKQKQQQQKQQLKSVDIMSNEAVKRGIPPIVVKRFNELVKDLMIKGKDQDQAIIEAKENLRELFPQYIR